VIRLKVKKNFLAKLLNDFGRGQSYELIRVVCYKRLTITPVAKTTGKGR